MAVPSRLLLSEMEISDRCRNCNRRKALFDIVGCRYSANKYVKYLVSIN
nr:MAG TPA: hypothetical protein [Caudoviricetes sp.]